MVAVSLKKVVGVHGEAAQAHAEQQSGEDGIAGHFAADGHAFFHAVCGADDVLQRFEDGRVAGLVEVADAVVAFVVLLLGLIPFPLPAPMYPEWQMEKRQRLAARSGAGSAEEAWRRAGFSTGDPDVPEGFEEEFSPYQTPRRYSGRHKRRRKWLP